MRRANGTGSIRKLCGKRRKKYQVIVTIKNENVRKQKHLGTFHTKKEAQTFLNEYLRNEHHESITFKEIYDSWSNSHYKKISNSTVQGYEVIYRKCKNIHARDIKTLKYNELQDVIDELSITSRRIGKTFLKMIFDYAIKNDYIEKNYADYIICEKYNAKEKRIFTKEEIAKLEKDTSKYATAAKILLYTGMRISELLNLTEDAIDISNKKISIQKSKTDSGIRCIPIHENILDCFVIKKEKITYDTIRNYLRQHYNHSTHDCRHTFATRCRELNIDEHVTKLILGHSTNDLTLRVYTHINFSQIYKEFSKFNYDFI